MPFVALASKLVPAHVTTCCIKTAIYDSATMAESDLAEATVGALLLLVAVPETMNSVFPVLGSKLVVVEQTLLQVEAETEKSVSQSAVLLTYEQASQAKHGAIRIHWQEAH